MAKLLSTANWPEDGQSYPEYPVDFQIEIDKEAKSDTAGWITCNLRAQIQKAVEAEKQVLFERKDQILARDLIRLSEDIKALLQQQQIPGMTFVPVVPSFELWLQHLSDEHYRAIIWHDLSGSFGGAADIAYQGVRFTTNRARLMGFARGLETEVKP
jgi:hypothetical protein